MSDLTQSIPPLFRFQVPHHGTQTLANVFFPSLMPPPTFESTQAIEALRARVDTILTVFDDPRYAHLDIPDWVHRATIHMPLGHHFSVRNLIRAMRDTADDLGLVDGERYVLTAVCMCVDNAKSNRAGAPGMGSLENQGEEVAPAVQHLASAWVAFLLWPCSPARRLQRFPGEFFRDGRPARVDCVRIFKHPLVVYKDVYDNDNLKHNSTVLSLELLRRYTQLSDKYTKDPMGSGVMDDPENNISLSLMAHCKFDRFGFAFVPTQTPNTYKVKDLSRFAGPDTLPDTVTFEDHSGGVDDNGQLVPPVSLPSRELLRMHAALGGALYASGVPDIFDRILNFTGEKRRDVGDLPLPTPDGLSFWKDVVDPDSSPDLVDPLIQSFASMHM
ncbi:hypothetical protein LXA43DRAFT_1060492 [Ganoderma leucocontextum]|nr:hypothetical protein LXA43DRAFT_1060492 [Ganoderma leucocontextum]